MSVHHQAYLGRGSGSAMHDCILPVVDQYEQTAVVAMSRTPPQSSDIRQ